MGGPRPGDVLGRFLVSRHRGVQSALEDAHKGADTQEEEHAQKKLRVDELRCNTVTQKSYQMTSEVGNKVFTVSCVRLNHGAVFVAGVVDVVAMNGDAAAKCNTKKIATPNGDPVKT